MPTWYPRPEDNMNLRTYRCKVSGQYNPLLPQRYLDGKMQPIYSTVNPLEICRYCPAELVNIYSLGIYFEIPDKTDREEIIMILGGYYKDALPRVEKLPELREYLPKVLSFMEALQAVHARHLNYIRNEEKKHRPATEMTLAEKLERMRLLR